MGITVGEQQDRQRTISALNKLAAAAERIADALERLSPPPEKEEAEEIGYHRRMAMELLRQKRDET